MFDYIADLPRYRGSIDIRVQDRIQALTQICTHLRKVECL